MRNIDNEQVMLFSFLYDGESFANLHSQIETRSSTSERDGIVHKEIIYTLQDGLEIIQSIREYPKYEAYEQVLYFYNRSDSCSRIISELNDYDASFEFVYDAPPSKPGYRVNDAVTKIYSTTGSDWVRNEFYPKVQFILSGQTHRYTPTGGRSSQTQAPFFDVNRENTGVICAVGWTGQWQAVFHDQTSV